jgi:GNAT superfamily N-acetyltransferase
VAVSPEPVGPEPVGPEPVGLRLRAVPYTDPVVQDLVELVQQEYVRRYGGRDDTPVDPAQFAPPQGLFVVAWLAGDPVGCGGWRRLPQRGRVEIKRMYVLPAARGRGVARAILAELERTAAAAGAAEVVLETGTEQPEAMQLYLSSGYDPVTGYGHYAGRPRSRAFGKALGGVPEVGPHPPDRAVTH